MNVIIGLLLVGFGLKILSGKWYIGDKPIFFFYLSYNRKRGNNYEELLEWRYKESR